MFKYIYLWAVVLAGALTFIACSDDDDQPSVSPTSTGTVLDKDGNEYKWVRIGNLDWMTENLRCDDPFYEDVYNPKWTNEFGYGLRLTGNSGMPISATITHGKKP